MDGSSAGDYDLTRCLQCFRQVMAPSSVNTQHGISLLSLRAQNLLEMQCAYAVLAVSEISDVEGDGALTRYVDSSARLLRRLGSSDGSSTPDIFWWRREHRGPSPSMPPPATRKRNYDMNYEREKSQISLPR